MTIKIEREDGKIFPYTQLTRFGQKVEGDGKARRANVTPWDPAIVQGDERTINVNEVYEDQVSSINDWAIGYVRSESDKEGQVRFYKALSESEPTVTFDGLIFTYLPKLIPIPKRTSTYFTIGKSK